MHTPKLRGNLQIIGVYSSKVARQGYERQNKKDWGNEELSRMKESKRSRQLNRIWNPGLDSES